MCADDSTGGWADSSITVDHRQVRAFGREWVGDQSPDALSSFVIAANFYGGRLYEANIDDIASPLSGQPLSTASLAASIAIALWVSYSFTRAVWAVAGSRAIEVVIREVRFSCYMLWTVHPVARIVGPGAGCIDI